MSGASQLSGIVVPLATPLTRDGSVDRDCLHKLVEHELAGGVSGIFVLGTTGEGPHLEAEQRMEVVSRVCRQVEGRVPVLVGLCDASTAGCLRLARFATAQGADALVLTPPFYMPLSQEELLGYLRRVVPKLQLPVYLYNIPGYTKVPFAPDTVLRAVSAGPIAGLKDSSGDLGYFAAMRAAFPRESGFQLFCGPEEILVDAMRLGGDGGVCGGANLFPRLYVELYEAARDGRWETAASLQQRVRALSGAVYAHTSESSSYLRGLKSAMSALGLCREFIAEPLAPLPEDAQQKIREFVLAFRAERRAH